MRKQEIELWALNILERVKAKKPTEDDYAELKGEWPDAKPAARRIAGHANAARGEPIIWLIGVDEKEGVVKGANIEELSNWWSKVKSRFDGPPPELTSVVVPDGEVSIVALSFDTSNSPYVVKSEDGAGGIQREVPWREATSVRSANRGDLLKLLIPIHKAPLLEALRAELHPEIDEKSSGVRVIKWLLNVTLYIMPISNERAVMPKHKCSVTMSFDRDTNPKTMSVVDLRAPVHHRSYTISSPSVSRELYEEPASYTVFGTSTEIIADGPGTIVLSAVGKTEHGAFIAYPNEIHISAELLPVNAERPAVFALTFKLHHESSPGENSSEYRLAI